MEIWFCVFWKEGSDWRQIGRQTKETVIIINKVYRMSEISWQLSGDHMAVGKAYRAENVQGQNGNDQKEQIAGGWFGRN